MNWVKVTEDDSQENAFRLGLLSTIRYGINFAYLDKTGKPRNERKAEATTFVHQLISQIELGQSLGFIDINDERELKDLLTELERFTGRKFGDRVNLTTTPFTSDEIISLPIDDYLNENLRYSPAVFNLFPDLRAALEKISKFPYADAMAPIIRYLIEAKLDIIDLGRIKNVPMIKSSLKPIVITGAPGVGKTEIAKALTPVLKAIGVTRERDVYIYRPDSEIRPGLGASETNMSKIIEKLKKDGHSILVDDADRAFEGVNRDRALTFKANAIKVLMSGAEELLDQDVFIFLTGAKNPITDLFQQISCADAEVTYFTIQTPQIETIAEYVVDMLSKFSIKVDEAIKIDLNNALSKLKDESKLEYWKTANAIVAQLRTISKGDRLTGKMFPEDLKVDGVILAKAFSRIGISDDDFLVEIAGHKALEPIDSQSDAFAIGLDALRGEAPPA